MMMIIMIGFAAVFAATFIIELGILTFYIRNAGLALSWFFPISYFRKLEECEKIWIKEGKSPKWFALIYKLTYFRYAFVLGWLVLFIIIFIVKNLIDP